MCKCRNDRKHGDYTGGPVEVFLDADVCAGVVLPHNTLHVWDREGQVKQDGRQNCDQGSLGDAMATIQGVHCYLQTRH